jgi:nucleotide-binding universal stress UspA family protein
MFKTIVVGVDGRAGDADAIALARRLADHDATFVLTGVVDRSATAVHLTNTDLRRAVLASCVAGHVDALPAGAAVTEITTAGSVADGLLGVAGQRQADLIVVAASRRGTVSRLLAGDAVRAVLRAADRPVAVAPVAYAEQRGAIALIGAGYDGDDSSQTALDVARQIARRDRIAVRALDVVTAAHWPLDPTGMDVAVTLENDRTRAQQAIGDMQSSFGEVEGRVAVGRPVDALGELAREVDLLVVGAHHRGPLARMFYGSTSETLGHDLRCPLLVIPIRAHGDVEPAMTTVAAGR